MRYRMGLKLIGKRPQSRTTQSETPAEIGYSVEKRESWSVWAVPSANGAQSATHRRATPLPTPDFSLLNTLAGGLLKPRIPKINGPLELPRRSKRQISNAFHPK